VVVLVPQKHINKIIKTNNNKNKYFLSPSVASVASGAWD
jgi:hypothetical protein